MLLRSFKLFAAALIAVLLSTACGGESAPAPTGLAVQAGESSVTLSWDSSNGVEYWLFYTPSSLAPTSTASMEKWFGLPGGYVVLKATSPYVLQGLFNGTSYTFSVNARIDGGPGGPGATPVSATPRVAGSVWTKGTPPSSSDLRGVAYGSTTATTIAGNATTTTTTTTTYVAVGAGGAMFSGSDGAAWSPINYATSSRLNGAYYFSSYKVVGDGGVLLTSPDAVTWTAQNSGTTRNLYAVASSPANYSVAVGAAGTIISSPDGVSWTAATNSATTNDLFAVMYSSYNGGTWLAVGAGGTMIASADGHTWHGVASNTSADLRGIAAGATSTSSTGVTTITFVAVGASGTVLSSTDATAWAPQVLPGVSANLNAVAYGTQFVAVGASGTILISTDGVNWTAASTSPANSADLYAVVRGFNGYSAVGAAGTNLLSR